MNDSLEFLLELLGIDEKIELTDFNEPAQSHAIKVEIEGQQLHISTLAFGESSEMVFKQLCRFCEPIKVSYALRLVGNSKVISKRHVATDLQKLKMIATLFKKLKKPFVLLTANVELVSGFERVYLIGSETLNANTGRNKMLFCFSSIDEAMTYLTDDDKYILEVET